MSTLPDAPHPAAPGLSVGLAPPVEAVLEAARSVAVEAGAPAIAAGHLALVLLELPDGLMDGVLQRHFEGLRAATIAASLRDVLELEADESPSRPAGAPPAPADLGDDARAALTAAAERCAADGLAAVTLLSLGCVLFEQPPHALLTAFQDAGVGPREVEALARHFPVDSGPQHGGTEAAIFRDGLLDLTQLGPTARRAVGRMAQRAAESRAPLTDLDLLSSLLADESSRFADALHVLGVAPAAVRRQLGRAAEAAGAAPGAATLSEARLSRLLRRVFVEAAVLAAAEHRPLVGESHLVRAHLQRVAGGIGNVYQRLGIDPSRLRAHLERYADDRRPEEERPESDEDLEAVLRAAVVNQDEAIARVLPVLKRMRAGLAEPGRPLGVFLFLGPTGVGKTELARAIATLAFGAGQGGRDACLIKLDCGNFTERRDIVQLLGAAQGLVGYKEGQLTNGLRDKPRSVVLLDEAEKAHPDVWQSLLPLFDEGIVREADGTEYDASGCFLIATSNLGYKEAIEEFKLWEREDAARGGLPPGAEDFIRKRVEEYFSPEFRGRFGRENFLFFRHFDRAAYRAIVSLQVRKLLSEMAARGLAVTASEEVERLLSDLAWRERQDGARPVRRLVTQHLRDQIVEAILADRSRTEFSFVALEGHGEIQLLD